MRKRRYSRKRRAGRISEREEENGRLRGSDAARREEAGPDDDKVPDICGRGYPTRALPFRATSLEEAKKFIMSGDR